MPQPGEAVPFEIPGATGNFRIQILNEDRARGVVTSIVHLPPGGRIPAHYHDAGSEMHYVLEGDLIEKGQALGIGAFLTHAKGVLHGPHESKGGAKVLTVQTWQSEGGSFDFHPAEGGASKGSSGASAGTSSGMSTGTSSGTSTGAPSGTASGGAKTDDTMDRAPPPGGAGPADLAPSPEAARGAGTQEEAAEERANAKGYS